MPSHPADCFGIRERREGSGAAFLTRLAMGFGLCAAPVAGRRAACRIAVPKCRIGRILGARRQCNWACGRYSPRRFRTPVAARGDCAGSESTKDRGMFVTPAFAQGSPLGGDSMWMQLLPFVLIFVIMYFLILLPQQQRAKEHQALVH